MLLLPSRPTLPSLSKDEPLLTAGDARLPAGPDGATGCICGFLASFLSSSSDNCGSSLRLRESNCAFHIRSISDLYINCCSATLYRCADFGLFSASARGNKATWVD